MLNDNRDDFGPPLDDAPPRVPPVRRDPSLSIGDRAAAAAARVDEDGTPYSPGERAAKRRAYIVGTVIGAAAAAATTIALLILLGLVAHEIWRAIMLGWWIG